MIGPYARCVHADRLIQMVLTLQARGPLTARRLADELQVSVRTVYRDVSALSSAGIPVVTESGPGGGIGLMDGYQTRLTGLTATEAAALGLAGAPEAARQLGLGPGLSTAQSKLDAALPVAVRDRTTQLRDRILIDAPGWFSGPEDVPNLGVLATAVLEGRRMDLRYRRGSRIVERRVGPLGLVVKAGTWYLVARAGRRGDLRTFRVSRIVTVSVRDDVVHRPDGFDLAVAWSELGRAFDRDLRSYAVHARVPADRLRRLRRALPRPAADETIAGAGPPDPDGWCDVDIRSESLEVALDELLRMGADLEVVRPMALRRLLASTGEQMAARHGAGPAPA